MKIVQICVGRFHHFDLARELHKRGLLECIYTGYPSFKLKLEGLPPNRVRTFPWLVTPYMAFVRWETFRGNWEHRAGRWIHETMDAYVAATLPGCDVLIALSGSGLKAGRLAQSRGGRFLCDRGSSHICYQDAILREEFSRWGERFPGIDPVVMAREEEEYEQADIVTVPSEFALRSFTQMGILPAKLRKVPYGVDLSRFSKCGDADKDRFNVLFAGQICYRKGIPYLLSAFARLKHPGKQLIIVGGLQPEMKRYLDRFPPQENVRFLGHMPQLRLKEIMSRSHVMVLPSVEEGLATVQAQALACGCPVIGTWNSGAEDLFTDGVEGFIVQPRDPIAIGERLQLLADDPDKRMKMSEAALRRVGQIGGWSAYGERMETVLNELSGLKCSKQTFRKKGRLCAVS